MQLLAFVFIFSADNTAVVYNKFDVSPLSSPDHHPPHPDSDHDCVVDTVGHWTVARCAEEHLTVCQSDHLIAPGIQLLYTGLRKTSKSQGIRKLPGNCQGNGKLMRKSLKNVLSALCYLM